MVERPGRPAVVVGPSHVVRWQSHVRGGVVDSRLSPDRFIGVAGAPMWSASLLRRAAAAADDVQEVAVVVGDFRFGNGVLLADPQPSGTLVDGFVAITPSAMSHKNDRMMLDRGLAGMRAWHETFGSRARYVLWDIFARQVHDRLAGRHISAGPYRHPVFNYDEIAAALPGLRILDLSPLLRMPMHEIQRLLIDMSNHPSQIGYLLLDSMLLGELGAREAYDRAVTIVESELLALAREVRHAAGRPLVLTGRSVWLDTLSRYLGATGGQRLARAGLVIAPLDRVPGQQSPAQMMDGLELSECAITVLSAGGADLSPQLARAFGDDASRWADGPIIDWERSTEAIIRERNETPNFVRLDSGLPPRDGAMRLDLKASQVELGPGGMPSWTGITGLLREVAGGRCWQDAPSTSWRIHGDVLITRDNVAFLIGGHHEPLKYATGELRPADASLRNFAENVANRAEHAAARRISYAHVVFPDKQSVLVDEFPFQPVVKLGETYLRAAPSDVTARVVYPAADLQLVDGACMPLDSHLSDLGSLVVLRRMLEAVGVDAPAALARIERRITRPRRWPGDLGGKLTPQPTQEVLLLAPDWALVELTSGGGFNDGMVDILISPDAPFDRTVLLFGDSFFRMMLKHLSGIFTRVVCLRTRFYHREMVDLIEPDIVFSGNAERYLSKVDADAEAMPFMLYRPARGVSEPFDPGFFEAWRSMTSPRAQQSRAYLEDLGVGARSTVAAAGSGERAPGSEGARETGDTPTAPPAPTGGSSLDHAKPETVRGARSRACYRAAPYMSLKHSTYFAVYDQLFSRFIGRAPTIVEVGVLNGGSLYMWREFFGRGARILGLDLNPEATWLREEGFEIHIGDQSDAGFWERFFREVGDVDILLDDGGHTFPQQIVTASSSIDHIRDGGLLVVEDTHTSYMPEFGGPSEDSFVSWAGNLVHGLNHRFSALADQHDSERRVWSVQFFESIVALHVDRHLAGVESRPTTNHGRGRDAKDFRYRSEIALTDDELRSYFKY